MPHKYHQAPHMIKRQPHVDFTFRHNCGTLSITVKAADRGMAHNMLRKMIGEDISNWQISHTLNRRS